MSELLEISLVSPVFNEEAVIEAFVRRAAAALEQISAEYEMVLVNDASTDRTPEILAGLASEFPQLRVISLRRNSGQHAATVIGLNQSRGRYVFLMDSDLQIQPEDMARLYELGQNRTDWDLVMGRRSRRSAGLTRSIGSRVVSRIIQFISKTPIKDPGSTFMLLSRETIQHIRAYDVLAFNFQILIGILGLRVLDTPVEYTDNPNRQSSYRFIDLLELLVMALLNFTTGRGTLMVLVALGALLQVIGGGGTCLLIARGVALHTPLPTNLLIFLLILWVLGVQFNFLGILAFKIERINRNLGFRKVFFREFGRDRNDVD